MSIYDQLPAESGTLDGVWTGTIAVGAEGAGDEVEVLLDSFDNVHKFGPCKWFYRGGVLPERGNECLVVFNEEQVPFVISWWPFDPSAGNGGGGNGGGGDKNYVHTQSTLASTWTVTHNLGKLPTVAVLDSGDSEVMPNLHYDGLNQLTVTFASPTSGKVVCN